jgi:hypothetical protein
MTGTIGYKVTLSFAKHSPASSEDDSVEGDSANRCAISPTDRKHVP